MKALSLMQPWAWLIVTPDPERPNYPLKDVENRTWRLPMTFVVPQRIYVHASLRWDRDAFEVMREVIYQKNIDVPIKEELTFGAIIGEVTIMGCVTESDNPWFMGPYGFQLMNPTFYETPIACKGQLGFWKPPTDIMEPTINKEQFDWCECGDYRRDHDPETGRRIMPSSRKAHGMQPCLAFKLFHAASTIPEPFRSR